MPAGACLPRANLLLLTAVVAWLTACGRYPEYTVPPQKVMPSDPEPVTGQVVKMSDPRVETYFVRDVLDDTPGSRWRWTRSHPRFRLPVDTADHLNFYTRFTVPGPVLAKVPRVCVTFVVNSTQLGSRCYSADASYEFESPVRADVFSGATVELGMDIDPVLLTDDGERLGILIQEIGFKRRTQ